MNGFRPLLRLALRRDRLITTVWVLVLGLTPSSSASSYETFYPTAVERARLTTTIGRNPSVAVLYGRAFDLSTAGGFTAWRLGGMLAVLTALMAMFTVARHTRADEDTGRAELVASGVVGRLAPLAAGVTAAAGASVAVGVLQAVAVQGSGSSAAGSWALGAATAGCGLAFTGVAAVTAQVASDRRTANGLAGAVLGAAFLLRAVGDSSGGARWLSWLSPIGWAQQVRPFAHERWWVLLLPLALTVASLALAGSLVRRRDLGVGLLPPRPGPPRAAAGLRTPVALGWRLHRGALAGWAVGVAVGGAVFGSIADGVKDIIGDSQQAQDVFARLGGSAALADAYLATMVATFAMVLALHGIQATLRLRSEETEGRAEPVLATAASRLGWSAGHLLPAFGGSAALAVLGGAAMGVTDGLRRGDVPGRVADLVVASVAQLPALWLVVGLAVLLVGAVPRASAGAWALGGVALGISLLGPVLDLPQVVLDLSPFGHVPKLPGGAVHALPLAVLAALALASTTGGLAALRRRDVG